MSGPLDAVEQDHSSHMRLYCRWFYFSLLGYRNLFPGIEKIEQIVGQIHDKPTHYQNDLIEIFETILWQLPYIDMGREFEILPLVNTGLSNWMKQAHTPRLRAMVLKDF